jgi:MFS transporter, PPP family, 3-phenylpropionic acid transporter
MVLPSIYYFIYYAAISFLIPYLALFYQGQGLTGGQIGVLSAISPLVALLSAPLWSGTADVTHRHKAVTVVAILGSVTMALVLSTISVFAGFILAISLYAFFSSPIISLNDSAVMALLGERGERYGRIRIWGTIGWGAMAPIAGQVIGRFGLRWAFWGYAIFMLIGLLILTRIPFRQSHSSNSFLSGMRTLFANRPWMLFLVMVFIAGIGTAAYNNYLFVYMESLGASKALMGIAITVSTISELPVMFFSHRLLQRFGARGLLVLAMGTIGLRLMLYSQISLPWTVLLVQLVHGFTYPAILLAGVSYANQIAPPGMKATTQGMFSGTLMGLAAATGGLLGGVLMERFHPAGMFGIIGAVVLVSLVVFLLFERRFASAN